MVIRLKVLHAPETIRVRAARASAVLRFITTHPANRNGRLKALFRSTTFEIASRLVGRTRLISLGDAVLWADRRYESSVRALHGSPPDWNEMKAWERHLRPGDVFIDVGANIGVYTLWAAQKGAEVIALEPNDPARARLEEHVRLNGYNVKILPLAAGEEEGFVKLTNHRDSANHLVKGVGTTPVVPLDKVIRDQVIAGLKVDVEGAERLVLAGCQRALQEQRIKLLQIEWNALSENILGESRLPIQEMLVGFGYEFYRPNNQGVLERTKDLHSHVGCPDVFAAPSQRLSKMTAKLFKS